MRTFIAKAVFDDGVTKAAATAEYSEPLGGSPAAGRVCG